jgi:hypothetical protein
MGYGVNVAKHPTKKWGTVITYSVTGTGNRTNFDKAMTAWRNALSPHIRFSEAPQGVGEVDIDIAVGVQSQRSNTWTPKDGLNGRDSSRQGTLYLLDTASPGTVIHEIGHMLGLCHEHDRQNCPLAQARRANYFDGERVAKQRWDLANPANSDYVSYSDFDNASMMLYGSGYAAKDKPSDGDVATVLKINGKS